MGFVQLVGVCVSIFVGPLSVGTDSGDEFAVAGKKLQIWPSFGHGYYVANMEPAQLKETLEKEITRKDIPAEAKKRAQTLINSLDEEGNNVILLAKMKK